MGLEEFEQDIPALGPAILPAAFAAICAILAIALWPSLNYWPDAGSMLLASTKPANSLLLRLNLRLPIII